MKKARKLAFVFSLFANLIAFGGSPSEGSLIDLGDLYRELKSDRTAQLSMFLRMPSGATLSIGSDGVDDKNFYYQLGNPEPRSFSPTQKNLAPFPFIPKHMIPLANGRVVVAGIHVSNISADLEISARYELAFAISTPIFDRRGNFLPHAETTLAWKFRRILPEKPLLLVLDDVRVAQDARSLIFVGFGASSPYYPVFRVDSRGRTIPGFPRTTKIPSLEAAFGLTTVKVAENQIFIVVNRHDVSDVSFISDDLYQNHRSHGFGLSIVNPYLTLIPFHDKTWHEPNLKVMVNPKRLNEVVSFKFGYNSQKKYTAFGRPLGAPLRSRTPFVQVHYLDTYKGDDRVSYFLPSSGRNNPTRRLAIARREEAPTGSILFERRTPFIRLIDYPDEHLVVTHQAETNADCAGKLISAFHDK